MLPIISRRLGKKIIQNQVLLIVSLGYLQKSTKLSELTSDLDTLIKSDRFDIFEDKITKALNNTEGLLKISPEHKLCELDCVTGLDSRHRCFFTKCEKGREKDPCEGNDHCQTGLICEHR